MTFQQLRYAVTIAKNKSMNRAAEELYLSQPSLSGSMKDLEAEIGFPIFLRSNRGITLTDQGEVFLNYANELSRVMSEARRAVTLRNEPAGTLRIASMQTTAQILLPEMLSRFHKEHPKVRLEIRTGLSVNNARAVMNDNADFGFIAGEVKHKDLSRIPVTKEHLVLLSSDKAFDIRSADNLAEQTLLVFPQGCAYRERLEAWMKVSRALIQDEIIFDSLPAILAAVCSGLGVTLLPEESAKQLLKSRYLYKYELPEEYSVLSLSVVYRKERYLSPADKAFIDACCQFS